MQKMLKFYQQPSPNPETNFFHHGLIHILVEFHLVNTGDTWQDFLVRNEFLPAQIDPIIYSTQSVEEPFTLKASPNSPHDFWIQIQIQNDPVISLDAQTEVFYMARLAPKRSKFVPRKPLEVVLIHLRNQSLSFYYQP